MHLSINIRLAFLTATNRNSLFALLWAFFFFFCGMNLHAQSRKQLEAKRQKAQEEIKNTKKILNETSKKKNLNLHQLNTLNRIIVQRESLINDLKEEIGEVDKEIEDRNATLKKLKDEYEKEKIRFNKAVVKAYKTRKSVNKLAFIFAAPSFRTALKRLRYLRKMGEYQQHLIEEIKKRAAEVSIGLNELEETKNEKNTLLTGEVEEKRDLEKDKEEKAKVVKQLSAEEKNLRKRIAENERAIRNLNNAISNLIAKEIAAQKRAAAKSSSAKTSTPKGKGSTGSSSSSTISATPQAKALGADFAANRGGLPWPVDRGFISQSFGVHPHPDLPNITIVNNGVDITTSSGTQAKAIFKGTVTAIIQIPGQEKAVLVSHGTYYTVYSRLSNVFVSKGQEISSGQALGTVWTDDEGKTILQFQVWQGQAKQNPALWIISR